MGIFLLIGNGTMTYLVGDDDDEKLIRNVAYLDQRH
jgi:hypothetical protein